MNLFILNRSFELSLLVEAYQSLIWNDKYNEPGDFELYLPAASYDMSFFEIGNYVWSSLSDRLMIIEELVCQTDQENGDFLTVTGRSLESILERRIILYQLDLNCGLQDAVERILNENVISPSNSKRKINNVIFRRSTDTRIASLTVKTQCEIGDNVYDAIYDLINSKKVGMRMLRNNQNQFVFELYIGTDRSYAQQTNPWIVFSPEFDNLITSKYTESITDYHNQIVVGATYDIKTDTTADTKEITVEIGNNSGLDRFEFYVGANDIVSRTYDTNGNETVLTENEFRTRLIDKGNQTLEKYKKEVDFDTEVDYAHTFKMNEDYFLGDILQVTDEYGNTGSLRVNEYIISVSDSGIEHYPVFVNPNKEDQNEL